MPEAGGVNARVLKRLRTCGKSLVPATPCSWQGKPAAVAFTTDGVALASAALSVLSIEFAPYAQAKMTGAGRTRTIIFIAGPEVIEFDDSPQADDFSRQFSLQLLQIYERDKATRSPMLKSHDVLVPRCTYLGGSYLPLLVKREYDLLARDTKMDVLEHPARGNSRPVYSFEYSLNLSVEIGGPGEVTSGGGWSGGGFDVSGAIEGGVIAAVLNGLTTKRTITSIVAITDRGAEGFFLNTTRNPADLRRDLSPLFVRLRDIQSDDSTQPTANLAEVQSNDLVSRLERLAALCEAGALSSEEFATAKAALLRGA